MGDDGAGDHDLVTAVEKLPGDLHPDLTSRTLVPEQLAPDRVFPETYVFEEVVHDLGESGFFVTDLRHNNPPRQPKRVA